MDNLQDLSTICQCLNQLELDEYRSLLHDHRSHKLFTGNTIQLHVAAQLLGLTSYDMIAEQLQVSQTLRERTQLDSISPSALSRKTAQLCTDTLQAIFFRLVQQIATLHPSATNKLPGGKRLKVIDATELVLPLQRASWAYCSFSKRGVKMHTRVVIADPKQLVYADRFIASTADVDERAVSLQLVTDPDAIHVMDRGYQNHHHFEQWTQPGKEIPFVARVRANTQMIATKDFRLSKADKRWIFWDRKVTISKCSRTLRAVFFRDENDKEYYIITNCMDISATEIAQIYKYRWLIELFFKWLKQHLRLVKVISYSPQGIWNQLYLALIAFALCTWVRLQAKTTKTTWDILQLIRMYATHPWKEMVRAMQRLPTRKSKGRQRLQKPREPMPVLKKWMSR
ncbi:IS4 family transposase [Cohnella cellulosilytica]|uniref:IS4 family transposase n=1 Tax=Cohnella cellulosilytica TaxID=986710 RepID=UPI0036211C4F